jgi:hypothetical protein
MKRMILFAALLLVTGCITTAQELISTSKDKKTIVLDRNYQTVFRDVLTVSRDCLAGPLSITVSDKVEGQLYNDLGFGEISFYQDNLSDMHHVYVKIAKVAAGSEVSIYSDGSAYLKLFEEYVRGKKDC